MFLPLAMVIYSILAVAAPAAAQHRTEFTTPTPVTSGSTLILGFLGGGKRSGDENRPAIQLAERLRALEIPAVYIETTGHDRYTQALKLIEAATRRDAKGRCPVQGCSKVQLLLYGRGEGGATVLRLARELKILGLPVALTVQVDTAGRSDGVIPSNVARAANLYDAGAATAGAMRIHAEDPAKTQILANLLFSDDAKWVDLPEGVSPGPPRRARSAQFDSDPQIWNRVEDYILDEMRRAGISGVPAPPPH
ncbi:MAG TPA: hypothetical protein VJX29_04050 [Candidatus Acidoferrales bacterium]|nr:hypothetical protein [Candidatus Acidoferrales bacterium]